MQAEEVMKIFCVSVVEGKHPQAVIDRISDGNSDGYIERTKSESPSFDRVNLGW